MTPTDSHGRNSLSDGGWGITGTARLAIGLIQGVILAWLIRAAEGEVGAHLWPATQPYLYGPMILVAAYLPAVLLAGVGRLRLLTLVLWGLGAAALLALLGWSDIARQSVQDLNAPPFLDFPLLPFAAAALFIGHHLILPADRERRLIAAFPTYFDTAWLAGVQLALSIGFTLAFWLLLNLGGALFGLIGLKQLNDLLRETWFVLPLLGVAFALAVQLTDVRPGLIRGVRSVALMLLSWLLLLITVLVGGFLIALPFTGMEGLWRTGSASALVLAAAGALIILINTAYQDGQPDNRPPAVLRIAVRVASVLLTPLIAIAVWGLSLRIGQYGLTPDRIIASACALIGAVYAGGYGFAALSPFWRGGDWMKPLERTNVFAAVLTVLVIVCLFTPLADPARLSVASQVARLERDAVAPDKFDYRFLRFDSGRAGEAALARLARSSNAEIAQRAKAAEDASFIPRPIGPQPVTADQIRIRPHPADTVLPPSFVAQYGRLIEVLGPCRDTRPCDARLMDLDRDGRVEVLVAGDGSVDAFKQEADGRWFVWAAYYLPSCSADDVLKRFGQSPVQTADPAFPDLVIDGVRMRVQIGEPECASEQGELVFP